MFSIVQKPETAGLSDSGEQTFFPVPPPTLTDPRHPLLDRELWLSALRFEQLKQEPAMIERRMAALLPVLRDSDWTKPQTIANILPKAAWLQSLLLHPNDRETMLLDAAVGGAYGAAYQAILDHKVGEEDLEALHLVLKLLWQRHPESSRQQDGHRSPISRGERWLPPERQLSATHRYAFDAFFTWVEREGRSETGPTISSISRGIVMASAADWQGGDKPSLYESGGLSPKAGNGVIIYNPDEQRWYLYMHLNEVFVQAGSLVSAGQAIGNGGNTGINARKPGHGAHVHLEIFNKNAEPWTNVQIRRFVSGLR